MSFKLKAAPNSKVCPKFSVYLMLFFTLLPIAIAWAALHYDLLPKGKTNHGTLINPPVKLENIKFYTRKDINFPTNKFKGKWSLLYFSDNNCAFACQQSLLKTRQLHKAMGKEYSRINRYYITKKEIESEKLDKNLKINFPDLKHLITHDPNLITMLDNIAGENSLTTNKIYLVDPLGRLMMFYPEDIPPKQIMQDLRKLLKVSKIG